MRRRALRSLSLPSDLCGCPQKEARSCRTHKTALIIIWPPSRVVQVNRCACTKVEDVSLLYRTMAHPPSLGCIALCMLHPNCAIPVTPPNNVPGRSYSGALTCSSHPHRLVQGLTIVLFLSLCSGGTSDTSISHSYKRQADLSACAFASLPSSPAIFLRTALVVFCFVARTPNCRVHCWPNRLPRDGYHSLTVR